jgi:hypothetical protein
MYNHATDNPNFRQIFIEITQILSSIAKITPFLTNLIYFSNTFNKSRYFMQNFVKIQVKNAIF